MSGGSKQYGEYGNFWDALFGQRAGIHYSIDPPTSMFELCQKREKEEREYRCWKEQRKKEERENQERLEESRRRMQEAQAEIRRIEEEYQRNQKGREAERRP